MAHLAAIFFFLSSSLAGLAHKSDARQVLDFPGGEGGDSDDVSQEAEHRTRHANLTSRSDAPREGLST